MQRYLTHNEVPGRKTSTLVYDGVVALGWDAQRQAHQLLQSQRHHQQLYGSLLAAAAAAAVSHRAMIAQRQAAAGNTSAASDHQPAKKTPAIWSPATDIENNNNNNNGDAGKWEADSDRAKMRYSNSCDGTPVLHYQSINQGAVRES